MYIHDAVSTGRIQEMMSSIRLQHYDVASCNPRHLTVKHHCCQGVSACYNLRKFGKVSFIHEGVIAFLKKVHVFETPCTVRKDVKPQVIHPSVLPKRHSYDMNIFAPVKF